MSSARIIVVGGGAWGLPAALQLQDRGYSVSLVERFVPGGPYASSGGSSRLWRLADPQIWRSRALVESLYAMERLSERLGHSIFSRTGLLWRDEQSLHQIEAALDSIGQRYDLVPASQVGEYMTGLRSDGRPAVFVEQAGIVHADRLLSHALSAFQNGGGTYLPNTRVIRIEPGSDSSRVVLEDGSVLMGEQVLIAAGPGTNELLLGLEIALPLKPYIEQVVYLGNASVEPPARDLPSFVDCPIGTNPGIYAMPNGPLGYKVGLDHPLRSLAGETLGDDLERSEDPKRTETIRSRIERDLSSITPHVLGTQVCTWTDSGDGDFIIGRVHPTIVLACGDSGEGFKFSAFMGEYLADLVEGGSGESEFQLHWEPHRFGDKTSPRKHFDAIGRH